VQSIEIIRWLFLFFALAWLCIFTLRQYESSFKHIPTLICILCLVYYIGYIIQGLYSENILKVSRWDSQGTVWVGSSYAVLPLIVGIPCGVWLFGHSLRKLRLLGLSVGIVAVVICFYYESRILMLLLASCLAVSFFVIGWKRALIYIGIILATWGLLLLYTSIMRSINQAVFNHSITLFNMQIDTTYFNSYKERLGEYLQLETTNDNDRMLAILAPINASSVLGYGTYQHHYVLSQYINDLGCNVSQFVRTTGFGSFLVDYGWTGFGLLIINFICVGLKLILNRSRIWLLLGISLCFGFGWLFVSNILDNVLWWLLIVPFGMLERLNYEANQRVVDNN
jgi:hypothetical protein